MPNGIIRSCLFNSNFARVHIVFPFTSRSAQGNWKHASNSRVTESISIHSWNPLLSKSEEDKKAKKRREVRNYEFRQEIVERRITNPEKRLPVLSHTSKIHFMPLCASFFLLLAVLFRQRIIFVLFLFEFRRFFFSALQRSKLNDRTLLCRGAAHFELEGNLLAVWRIDRNSILKAFHIIKKSIYHKHVQTGN